MQVQQHSSVQIHTLQYMMRHSLAWSTQEHETAKPQFIQDTHDDVNDVKTHVAKKDTNG